MIEPGYYPELKNSEYHGGSGTSSTTLKKLLSEAPAKIKYDKNHPAEKAPEAYLIGSAVHCMVLEPHKFGEEFGLLPELNLRTKDGRAERDAFALANKDKQILTEPQYVRACDMATALLKNKKVQRLLSGCLVEQSIFWQYENNGINQLLKCRPDAIGGNFPLIIDIKTCQSAHPDAMKKAVVNYGYHISAALYLLGVNQCDELLKKLGRINYVGFALLCVESSPPYATAVYEISDELLQEGRRQLAKCLKLLQWADDNDWPGYPEVVSVLEAPAWIKKINENQTPVEL